jgi:hypothetical protein
MGAVGKWMAWEPNPDKVTDQEYANEQLNTLMKKYRENEENREVYYNEQKKAKIASAKTRTEAEVKLTESSETANTPFDGSSPAGTYDGMFADSGDLAIRRKMNGGAP